ncbi:hypothetical protein B296_00002554 [Ensete ventricosum]|uniref:Uncharacterized protein n=1 Tax=Ensete ventricosum TaxID=4639 RepID=A0A426ZQ63_ENSVE|nr:hypothetical protein B296_00002554 [Ensete ventricosum]
MRNGDCDDAAKSSGLRWCSSQVASMLMEDGSQGDLDHEATATVEEEEGSSNVGCGKGAAMTEGRRVVECTVVAEEGGSGVEREAVAGNLRSKELLLPSVRTLVDSKLGVIFIGDQPPSHREKSTLMRGCIISVLVLPF